MADKHLAGATELEKARALMQDEIDAKTQDALWWKTRCEQQSAASPATSRASLHLKFTENQCNASAQV